MPSQENYYELDSGPDLQGHIRKERERAQKLRKSQWWASQLSKGLCHYCRQPFPPSALTMDHIVPLARGGKSTRGNTVPACAHCNQSKQLETPAERLLNTLKLPQQRS